MTLLALTMALAAFIGISLGMLGGGGSILAVPLLVYVAGLPAKEAIATSLFLVAITSATALVPHARAGRVRWRTGVMFGLAGMVGAYAGGRLAAFVPDGVLLGAFALMMLATAAAMVRGRRGVADRRKPVRLPMLRAVVDGAAVGLVTGLVGAGGGFLVVPALVLLGGLPMPAAVGTSLVVIAMKSAAALAGYLSVVDVHWGLAAAVTAAAVVGSLIGGRLVGVLREEVLRAAFGWFVLVMGVVVFAAQLPGDLRANPWLWSTLGLAGLTAAVGTLRTKRWAVRSGRGRLPHDQSPQ